MHIEQTHKDAHHHAAVMEVLVFLHLFHHHYLAVGRGNHHIVGITGIEAYGALEEVEQHSIYNHTEANAHLQDKTG